LGRGANLDPLGGGNIAADLARHDDRGGFDLRGHDGALADHDAVLGGDFTVDLAVDPCGSFETELAAHFAALVEVGARLQRSSRRLTWRSDPAFWHGCRR